MENYCIICDRYFTTVSGFKNHNNYIHDDVKSHECNVCERVFSTSVGLKTHFSYAHTERTQQYTCHKCDKVCSTLRGLQTHVKYKHSPGEIHTCDLCYKSFGSSQALKLHVRYTHDGHEMKCKNWNKGKTSEEDERIKKGAKKLRERYSNGELSHPMLGKTHSNESKKLISEKALQSSHRRLVKSTRNYIKKDGDVVLLDSSWEEVLASRLDYLNIEWTRPTSGMTYLDKAGKTRTYYPDFYLPKFNVYIDPKNHYALKVQAYKVNEIVNTYNNVIFIHDLNECMNINEEYIVEKCKSLST